MYQRWLAQGTNVFEALGELMSRRKSVMENTCKCYEMSSCWYIHHTHAYTYMYIVVNFDALAQASDILIERRHVVFLCGEQDSNPSGSQTPNRQQIECPLTNRLSYLYMYVYIYVGGCWGWISVLKSGFSMYFHFLCHQTSFYVNSNCTIELVSFAILLILLITTWGLPSGRLARSVFDEKDNYLHRHTHFMSISSHMKQWTLLLIPTQFRHVKERGHSVFIHLSPRYTD